jgi:hypothetical protein
MLPVRTAGRVAKFRVKKYGMIPGASFVGKTFDFCNSTEQKPCILTVGWQTYFMLFARPEWSPAYRVTDIHLIELNPPAFLTACFSPKPRHCRCLAAGIASDEISSSSVFDLHQVIGLFGGNRRLYAR